VVNKELLMLRRFQVDVKDIKCLLEWWAKHKSLFPTVVFLARQILGIVDSQIETEKKNSLVEILTNLRKCRLQSNNLDKIIFISKNWPNDPWVGCSSPFSLIELDWGWFCFRGRIWTIWRWIWARWTFGLVM
jgi:hypothetical protein